MNDFEELLNDRAKVFEVDSEQAKRIDNIRMAFSELYYEIEKKCKPSRETSLVFTKLEEAQYWAIKSITRERK